MTGCRASRRWACGSSEQKHWAGAGLPGHGQIDAPIKLTSAPSRKTEHRAGLTRLQAPVAGTVQQLAVHTPGGVVTAAQTLMVIVPDDAEVTAEVVLENKDIGFIHPGQQVSVKLDTFSFTRYGTVPAVVQHVAADAVVDDKRGVAMFPATVKLRENQIVVDGRRVALVPGMSLSAEIRTGQRRVIDYLLGPLQQRVGESLGER